MTTLGPARPARDPGHPPSETGVYTGTFGVPPPASVETKPKRVGNVGCERVLATGRPIASDRAEEVSHTHLAPVPPAVRDGRAFVRDSVPADLPDDDLDTLLLLTSELVTNGVLHARTDLVLGVTVAPDTVMVSVADRDGREPELQSSTDEQAGGRGIMLIDEVADDWGTVVDGDGKTVWFAVSRGHN